MKFNIQLIAIFFAVTACDFRQSAKKDFDTGAYSRGNGISSDEVLIQASGKTGEDNQFVYGETVNFVFNDVRGFEKVGDKVFPGMSLYITGNEKDTLLAYRDLLENTSEGTSLSPLQLQANFVAALPYRNNERYKVHVRIWDKEGDGSFSYELPFTVAENELLDIRSADIAYQNIYLWNESKKQPVLDNEIDQNEVYILLLEGVRGLTAEENKVFPVFSIELKDDQGTTILSNPNVLSDYEAGGANPEDVAGQLSATITFTQKGRLVNPCRLTAILSDKKSDKQLKITTELNITR